MISKRILITVAVCAGLAAAAAFGSNWGARASANVQPRAHAAAPLPTIDANTDPAAAGKAVSDFCQTISNCQFVGTAQPTVAYDPPRVIGDALYNCAPTGAKDQDAEDTVTISDERSESTNLEESLSTSVKLGILTAEAEATTKQFEKVGTTTSRTSTVVIPPGWEGWTETQVPTASVSGYITDGIHFKVVDFELSYPGYGAPNMDKILFTGIRQRMEDPTANPPRNDRHEHCDGLPPLTVPQVAQLSQPGSGVSVSICTNNGRYRCIARQLVTASTVPLTASRANVALARGSFIYATGTVRNGRILLRAKRQVRAGAYTLILSRPHDSTMLQVTIR